jgi:3-methyladenine DNA glycosylase AlkC
MSDENPNALKHMYNKKLLLTIAQEISKIYPAFDQKAFLSIQNEMLKLEMKGRVLLIREQLKKTLPEKYQESLKILLKSTESGKLTGFSLWPYTEFIQTFGLDHIKISLQALKEITPLFTSEWAVRPFIKKDLNQTLTFLNKCALDKNHHVRRWVSEGSRTRLPWGERLHIFIQKPELTCELIEPLIFDSELYVRKSVANHMNDITKDNPEYAMKVLKKWKSKIKTAFDKERLDWIIKHALRSLIKAGNAEALNLIGISTKVDLEINKFKIQNKNIQMGEKVEFDFEILSSSSKTQDIVLDYVVHFAKSNGTMSPKVFKLKNLKLKPSEKLVIKKAHPIKEITTRKYYSGEHLLEIQVNGQIYAKAKWRLKV